MVKFIGMKVPLIVSVIALIFAGSIFFISQVRQQPPLPTQSIPFGNPTATPNLTTTASFAIQTNGIARNFTAIKYHNQSPDVFISSEDPSRVQVKKVGVTWDYFFKTLPMKLSKDCLVTGDGETLCNDKGTLKFILNSIEDENALEKPIKDGDNLLVTYNP